MISLDVNQVPLVIGEVTVDVHLSGTNGDQTRMRLGGVMHACRAFWALGVNYHLAYLSPSYLQPEILSFARKHGAGRVDAIGTVTGSPGVVLIPHPEEAKAQGYEVLLRDAWEVSCISSLNLENITDVLIFPGRFSIEGILAQLEPKDGLDVHIDWSNTEEKIEALEILGRPFTNIFTSTSSDIFLKCANGDFQQLSQQVVPKFSASLIHKENRGGALVYDGSCLIETGSQLAPVKHSVGVGDCFDAVYVATRNTEGPATALQFASHIAGHYASTTFPDDFKRDTQRTLNLSPEDLASLTGTALRWEDRAKKNIYIAGPDFDYLNKTYIDDVEESLRYHNFSPRRPIQENGQASADLDKGKRRDLCSRDLEILKECHLLIAIYEIDDPGTLIEAGIAIGWALPVILFDPLKRASNLMLTEAVNAVASNLDHLIYHVFHILGESK